MRRFLLAFVLLLAVRQSAAAQSVVFGVGADAAAPANNEVSVPVFADMRGATGHRLGSYTARVQWNPGVLSLQDVEGGSFGDPQVQFDSVSSGIVRVAALSVTGADAVADLFRLQFHVVEPSPSAIDLSVSEASAAVTFTDLSSYVSVVNGAFCTSSGRWGDLDGDGSADSRDALAILSSVVGMTVNPAFDLALADVNGDARSNSLDALIILSYAVGLEIPGQRVLLAVTGSCGSGAAPSLAIAPDTVDLVVGQELPLKLEARAADGSLLSFVANWEILDPQVAAVDQSGLAAGRGVGVTRVTAALGPGIRFSVPVIVRPGRKTWHVNARVARGTGIQLGTQKWPFQSPQQAFPYLREGDTVRVAPGIHDYDLVDDGCEYECCQECCYECQLGAIAPASRVLGPMSSTIAVGAVLVGDTLPDGTRPVLRSTGQSFHAAAEWVGGRHGVVKDLVFRNFYVGVAAGGLNALRMENVRIEEQASANGYGVLVDAPLDSLVLVRSAFVADTLNGSYSGVYADAPVRIALVDGVHFSGWEDCGFCLTDTDSLDVRNSFFDRNGYQGGVGLYPRLRLASVVVSRSRFENNRHGLSLHGVRRAALDHNFVDQQQNYDGNRAFSVDSRLNYAEDAPPAFAVSRAAAVFAPGSVLTLLGDSMRVRGSYLTWLEASELDSVLIDSLWVESGAATPSSIYGSIRSQYGRLTHSRFVDFSGDAVDFSGLQFDVDQTEFSGCPGCANSAYGIGLDSYEAGGSGLTLTNSTFTILHTAVTDDSTPGRGRRLVANTVIDSVHDALAFFGDSVVIRDNRITRVRGSAIRTYGVQAVPLKTTAILRNDVRCRTGAYGVRVSAAPAVIEDNAVRGPCTLSIDATNVPGNPLVDVAITRDTVLNDSTVAGYSAINLGGPYRPTLTGNQVHGGYYGISLNPTVAMPAVVNGNALTNTGSAALYIAPLGLALDVSGTNNNISNNLGTGIISGSAIAGTRALGSGNLAGNNLGIENGSGLTFFAGDTWWGDPLGPSGPGGDGVIGPVDATNPQAAPRGDVPPLATIDPAPPAPPAFAAAASHGMAPVMLAAPAERAFPAPARPARVVDARLGKLRAQLQAGRAAAPR